MPLLVELLEFLIWCRLLCRKTEKYNVVHKQEDTDKEKKPEEISLYHREENA